MTLVSQLLEMHRRLSAMAEAERMGRAIRQEMERLFSLMNLPMEDTPIAGPGRQGVEGMNLPMEDTPLDQDDKHE